MKTRKLTAADGFVLVDLDEAPVSVGVVRSAPKILVSGAEVLARSVTYSFAAFGIRAGGASAGVNAAPDGRAAALAAFAEEVASMPNVLFDPGRGVQEDDLAPLRASDPRPAELRAADGGVTGADEALAAGALAALEAVGVGLSGARVAIEGLGPAGVALARRAVDAGAGVVAVGSGSTTAFEPGGFEPAALADACASHGEEAAKNVGGTSKAAWAIWGAEADVIFAGSKSGAMTHEGAGYVKARAVVPIGPAPITAKALAVLSRTGVTYVPDFLAVAGPLLVGLGEVSPGEAPGRVADAVSRASGHADGLFLGACEGAEEFLRSWQDRLPFGRPLA